MHGIYAEPPVLDIDRVKELREAIPDDTRIVMHGASGVEFDQVQNAITAGCSKDSQRACPELLWSKDSARRRAGRRLRQMVRLHIMNYRKQHMNS